MLFDLPDEVLHLVGQFIINTDKDLLESLYEGQLQAHSTGAIGDYTFRCHTKHTITASHFYLYLLGTLNREFHQRVFYPYFWNKNLFYLDQLTNTRIGIVSSNDEELYEEEYDEDLDEIIQIPIGEYRPARSINHEQITEIMERSEMRRMYLRVDSSLIQSMVDRVMNFYFVKELMIDSNNVDLFSVMNLVVFHCPFIEKVRVLAGRFNSDCTDSINYFEKQAKELNSSLKQLRIIYQLPNSDNTSPRIFEKVLETYLPHMKNIEEIVLPFWTPSILDSISNNCRHVKKLVLMGELVQGTYHHSFENICNNIEGLESFVISRSRVKGFYVDIGQAHFMRILSKFSKTLKEFCIGTNLSRFSSPSAEDSLQYEEELDANMPTQLETLIIENIVDHYYNSSTPLAFINILTSLLNRKVANSLFLLQNLTIDLNNFSLDNIKSISMKHVRNLYLGLSNSEQILVDLSNENYTSNIDTLQLDMNACDMTLEEISKMLKKPFFLKLENLLLINDGELLDITPLSEIPNLKSLKLLSHSREIRQNFDPLYRDNFSTRRTYSKSNGSFTLKGPTRFEEIDIVLEEELDLFESNLFRNAKSMTLDIEYFYSDVLRVLSPLSRNFPKLERFDLTIQTDMVMDYTTIMEKLRIMKNIKHASLIIESPSQYSNGLDLLILFYIFTFGSTLSDFKFYYLMDPEEDINSIFDHIFYNFISEEDHYMYEEIKQSFTKQIVQHLDFGE